MQSEGLDSGLEVVIAVTSKLRCGVEEQASTAGKFLRILKGSGTSHASQQHVMIGLCEKNQLCYKQKYNSLSRRELLVTASLVRLHNTIHSRVD